MKKTISFFALLLLFSCSEIVDKPKNLLSEDQMSEIIADFAIYDQSFTINPNANMELSCRYVLKKHETDAVTYRESYKYYLSKTDKMDDILKEAQKIILDKDSGLEKFMEKNKNKNGGTPSSVR